MEHSRGGGGGCIINWLSVVLNMNVVDSGWHFDNQWDFQCLRMMTTAQEVKTSVTVNNSHIQDYTCNNDHIPPFYERWSTCTSFSLTVFFGLVPAGTPLLFEVFWFLPGVVLLKSGCLGGVCVLCWVLENKSENQCYTEFLYLSIKCSLHVQHLLVMYRAYMCLLCHVFFSLSVMSVSFCLFCRCVCECS